jgi:DNA-binding MarR family transcriptional regulator
MALNFDPIAEARRQWEDHGWDAVDSMSAVTSIVRAQQLAMASISETLAPLGLTFSRYEALVLLHFSRQGQLPLGKMGARLMVHPASVTNTIDRLEADGLVARVPHPTDRRTTLARITTDGTRVMDQATAALVDIEFGVGVLNSSELNQIDDLIRTLREKSGDYEA